MAGLLPRFERHWRRQGAPIVEGLRPGLTDAEIDALMKPSGMRLSAEVRQLYRWHDGAEPHPELWDSGRLFAIGIWTFRPLAELVAWYQEEWLPGRAELALECDLEPQEIWPDGYFPVFLADAWRTAVLQDRRGDQDSFPRAVAYFDREWNFDSNLRHMSLIPLLETWLLLLDGGHVRWNNEDAIWACDEALHWTTYRMAFH